MSINFQRHEDSESDKDEDDKLDFGPMRMAQPVYKPFYNPMTYNSQRTIVNSKYASPQSTRTPVKMSILKHGDVSKLSFFVDTVKGVVLIGGDTIKTEEFISMLCNMFWELAAEELRETLGENSHGVPSTIGAPPGSQSRLENSKSKLRELLASYTSRCISMMNILLTIVMVITVVSIGVYAYPHAKAIGDKMIELKNTAEEAVVTLKTSLTILEEDAQKNCQTEQVKADNLLNTLRFALDSNSDGLEKTRCELSQERIRKDTQLLAIYSQKIGKASYMALTQQQGNSLPLIAYTAGGVVGPVMERSMFYNLCRMWSKHVTIPRQRAATEKILASELGEEGFNEDDTIDHMYGNSEAFKSYDRVE